MHLKPMVVITCGQPAAGKTTIAREIARAIDNAFYVDRDDVLYAGMLLANTSVETPGLPPLEEYLSGDERISPELLESFETPFGEMTRVHHYTRNGYYLRHAMSQSYVLMGRIAERTLTIGKVPVLGGFLTSHVQDGSLRRFMKQKSFAEYPVFLIYLSVEKDVCFDRVMDRAANDYEANIRARSGFLKRDTFEDAMRRDRHCDIPPELERTPHLLVNTAHRGIGECVDECLAYLAGA